MNRVRSIIIVLVALLVGGLNGESLAQSSFWRKVSGPAGAHVSAFTLTANGDVLAGTFKGVFLSTDGGKSWGPIDGTLANAEVWTLVAHPNGDLFAGTTDGISRSHDDGASWHAVVTGSMVSAMVVNADGVLFATTGQDVLRSQDGGDTWHAVNTGLEDLLQSIKRLAIHEVGVLFVGAYSAGVYRSSDDGAHWEAVNTGLTDLSVRVLHVTLGGDLLMGTRHGGVFRSTDLGESWQAINGGLPEVDVRALLSTANGDLFVGAYSGSDEGIPGGIYRSTDDGQSWHAVDLGPESAEVKTLSRTATGDLFAGTAGSAVYRSEDGGESWQAFSMGLSHTLVIELFTTTSGDVYAGTMRGGLHRTRDEGASWQAITNGLTEKTVGHLAESSAGDLVALAGVKRAFLSNDEGETWRPIADNLQSEQPDFTQVGFTPTGTILIGTYDGIIYRTEDEGASWTTATVPRVTTPEHSCSGNVWDFVSNDQGDIFTGVYCSGVFRSQDDGETWQAVNNGLTNLDVRMLARNVNGDLYVSAEGSIFRSQDHGASWTEISAGLPSTVVLTKSIVFSAQGDVYAVSFLGRFFEERNVYHFDTNAEQWIEIPTGFDRLSELTVSANGYLFAGTFGDGLYRSEEPMASIQQATALEPTGDGVPQAFALAQNYPNPFNPTTAITFELAAESSIALIIYNALGQEVKRLVEGRYRAGTYHVAWDGHDDAGQPVASGLYLYRLAADAFTQVRTMVLLR